MEDTDLLQGLKREPGNSQFEEIIDRYGLMVFNVCWRILHEGSLSTEAAAAVFFILSEKNHSVGKKSNLAGWLHRTAVSAASAMQKRITTPGTRSSEEDWGRIEPWIDYEVDSLPDKSRQNLIEGYLMPVQLPEEGDDQSGPGTSVIELRSRGMETIRERFAQRGLVVSLGSLMTMLSSYSCIKPLPENFSTRCLGALPQESVLLSRGVVRSWNTTRLKKTASVLILIAIILGFAVVASQFEKKGVKPRSRKTSDIKENKDAPPIPGGGTRLAWRELGSPEFYRGFKPVFNTEDGNLRIGAWWNDPDYVRGWLEGRGVKGDAPGKPMTDFRRFMTVAVFRKTGTGKDTLSIQDVIDTMEGVQVRYAVKTSEARSKPGISQILIETEKKNKPVLFYENGIKVGEVLPFRRIDLIEGYVSKTDRPKHTICRSIHDCVNMLPLSAGDGKTSASGKEWARILKVFFEKEMVVAGYFGAVTRPAEYDITQVLVAEGRIHVFLELSLGGSTDMNPGILAVCPRRDLPVSWYIDGEFLHEDVFVEPAQTVKKNVQNITPAAVTEISRKKTPPKKNKEAKTGSAWGDVSQGLQISCSIEPGTWNENVSSVMFVTRVRNVSDKPIRVITWDLFSDGLELRKESGREIRCMQFARARYKARQDQYPVIQPGETKEFKAEGKFTESRSEGWFSLTLAGLTGVTRRWSVSEGELTVKAVLENSADKNWLSHLEGGDAKREVPWTGRAESNEIKITVGE